jgi:hypothetical protein
MGHAVSAIPVNIIPIEAEKAEKALDCYAETSRRKIRKVTETLDIGGDDI